MKKRKRLFSDRCQKCSCTRKQHHKRRPPGTGRGEGGACGACPCLSFREPFLPPANPSVTCSQKLADATANAVPEMKWAGCPLAPHIPIADAESVTAYVTAVTADRFSTIQLVRVGFLSPKATIASAAKELGGGPFVLVYFGGPEGKIIGESHVILPGERSPKIAPQVKYENDRIVAERKVADAEAAKRSAFDSLLRAHEDALIIALSEIHHHVVAARFAVDPTVRDASLSQILEASDRGIEILVARLKGRPEPWTLGGLSWKQVVGFGVGALPAVIYAAYKPAAAGVGTGPKKP